MKHLTVFLIMSFILITGCDYQSPFTEEHNISVDQSVLGLWEEVPEGNRPPDPNDRLLVLKYSATEYLVHYPTGKDGMYFRAYAIKIDGVSCVQFQLIGEADGSIKEERKYQVVSYSLSNGELEVRTLNKDVIDKNLQDSASLRQAFIKHKNDKDLFGEPVKFRKVAVKG